MALRTRLLLAVAAVALIALVIADAVTYRELRSFLYGQIDQSLEQAHIPIESALGSAPVRPPSGGTGSGTQVSSSTTTSTTVPPSSVPPTSVPSGASSVGGKTSCTDFAGLSAGLLQQLGPDSFVEVRDKAGGVLCSDKLPGFDSGGTGRPALPRRITGFVSSAADDGERIVFFTAPNADRDDPEYQIRASVLERGPYAGGQLVVGVPLQSTAGTLRRLVAVEAAVTGAALLAALGLGWWLVRVGLRPLVAVERTAEAIAQGELAQRVPGETARTEVGRLARALNVMLGRIESAFAQRDTTEDELRASEARMRRFVADASHELRTPLTAVAAYAELFEQGAAARPEDLERVMLGIRSETDRMGHLVDDLLLLARLDEGRPLARDEVELVGVAAEAVQTASAVGPGWPVHLVAREPVEVIGDHLRLRQVVDNLLANVRMHCPEGTSSVVAVAGRDGEAVVSVTDDGPGLDPDAAGRVFERFYRADPSRSRPQGGAGLGLSIVASIVQAHGGRVEVGTIPHGGTVFTIHLPLASSQATGDGGEGEGHSQLTHS